MGICLDTEQQNGSEVFEDGDRRRTTGRWQGEAGLLSTPPDGNFPMQNIGHVKFESPKVPVIFVLGGPGSGKVTHCDNLMHEKKGITHINMTDLLQQYAMGNDMLDFGLLSSKTVTEVLMLEIKMSPNAKTFLISGYPRNMRDVVEYSEKIQIVNGVVLVSWRQEILERQIDYGAQLGHVILGLARMELNNFYRNVMPVAEYFDQSGMLVAVNGERNPSEVYVDFRDAVMKILGMSDGVDNKRRDPPGSVEAEVKVERGSTPATSTPPGKQIVRTDLPLPMNLHIPSKTANKPRKGLPYFIWVIGGPGSNKTALTSQAIENETGWVHVSVGSILRGMASSNSIVRDAILAGELVPRDIVIKILEKQVLLNRDTDGIVIDGFPRDSEQAQEFQSKFGQEPPLLLLDCSKLQLGRGRLDDSVSAFRRRLEIFRESSLPMLKELDDKNRLTIVDGDTDSKIVQDEYVGGLRRLIKNSNGMLNEGKKKERTNNKMINKNIESIDREEIVTISNEFEQLANGSIKDKSSSNEMLNNIKSYKKLNGSLKNVKKKSLDDDRLNFHRFNGGGNLTNVDYYYDGVNNGINGIKSISKKVQDQINHDNSNGGDGITKSVLDNGIKKMNNNLLLNDEKQFNNNNDNNNSNNNNDNNTHHHHNHHHHHHHHQNDNNGMIKNGGTSINQQNGIANGIGNGIGIGIGMVNGHLTTNKVAPVKKNFQHNGNGTNTVRNMYSEVEGYQNDMHI